MRGLARVLAPHTKLATTGWWKTTTLTEDFGVADASEDDLYAAIGQGTSLDGCISGSAVMRSN